MASLVEQWFWQAYNYLVLTIPPVVHFFKSKLGVLWPDFATTGLATSYAAVLASLPFFLAASIVLVWSIASCGPARKTLSTALIVTFVVPVYPVVTALVLAIFWTIVSFATWTAAVAGPLLLVALACIALWDCRPFQGATEVLNWSFSRLFSSICFCVTMFLACASTMAVCIFTLSLSDTPARRASRTFADMLSQWLQKGVAQHQAPDVAVVGFVVSYAAVVACFPYFVSVGFYKVWSLTPSSRKDQAAKSLGLSFLLSGTVLYPVITGIALALIWDAVSFVLSMVGIMLPFAMLAVAWSTIWLFGHEFVLQQREEASGSPAAVDDIGFGMLFFGFLMGVLSLCTWGVLAFLLTVVKAPIVFISCICQFCYHTLPLLKETGGWLPLALLAWCIGLLGGICALVLIIVLSALVKLVASAIWPAYITTGWLRFVGGGGRRREGGCCTPLIQGTKAGYQVLWASDLLTNAVIVGNTELLQRTVNEFAEIAMGRREQLSPECRKISILPPVVVGLFRGSWDMAERVIANKLGVSTDAVREAWTSLRDQMTAVGKESIVDGLMTEDYVLSIPPELVIGLPARVLLETVERSSPQELILANGLRLTSVERPRGDFADKVWNNLQTAREALAQAQLTPEQRSLLSKALLAGGGDSSDLPPGLASAVESFDQLPEPTRGTCVTVRNHLNAVAVECSRQSHFREQLEKVIHALGDEPASDAAYKLISGAAAC